MTMTVALEPQIQDHMYSPIPFLAALQAQEPLPARESEVGDEMVYQGIVMFGKGTVRRS